ncbi:hypothetical protein CASFOL_016644 [Castilleja foliolosa]|uniref:Uncharacterized protein n=1 Tax=Castilleja foliolosa TaxID=1961234 RepID=A0ABD3DAL4_9LAMI
MATLEDDFTFPAAANGGNSPPHFIESPPLWRRPTTADEKPDKLKGKEAKDDEKSKLCSFQDQFKKSSNFVNEDEEEKMDVLWENLNDESSRNGVKIAEECDVSSSSSSRVQIRCAKSLRLSRANGQMFSSKKPIVLVFIEVMKKVLLKHNSNRIKKQAW